MRKPWRKPFDVPDEGKIHLHCPGCYRRALNMPRQPEDPDGASVMQVWCENHDALEPESRYFDLDGNEVDWRPKAGMPVYTTEPQS